MKKYLLLALIALTVMGCTPSADQAAATTLEEKGSKAEEIASKSETNVTPAAKTESKRNSPGSIDLAGMVDMEFEEAMEIDHMRERINKENWGDVMSILTATSATFEKEGSCCLVAKGEVKQNGHLWAAQMILDLDQDAVFGVQWDGENKRVDQFEDDIEGLDTPQPMIDFTSNYNR